MPLFNILIFVVLLLLELIYFRIADRFDIIDKPNMRSSHAHVTLRGGGIIFYMGVLAYTVFWGLRYPWFVLGLTLVSGISFIDDIRPVPNRYRLLFHFLAMFLMFYQWGLFVGFSLWYLVMALFLCTGIINAYNFMDGINGITGGYSLVVLVSLSYVNHRLGFIDERFLVIAILSVLVFNIFNFRKRRYASPETWAVSVSLSLFFLRWGGWCFRAVIFLISCFWRSMEPTASGRSCIVSCCVRILARRIVSICIN